jgi:hypothetical protein
MSDLPLVHFDELLIQFSADKQCSCKELPDT